jgi:ribosomal protein S18 acetylase RimI-like enzyme
MNANAVVLGDSYTVSDAGLLDLVGIWQVQRACFLRDAYDGFTLLNLAITPNVLRLKAVADDRLVGYLAGELHRSERVGWIVTVGVVPRYTGRGIGRALLSSAERAMRTSVLTMRLTVRRSNARAINLYDRCGYQWVNTMRHYYHDGEDGLVMEKNLTLP